MDGVHHVRHEDHQCEVLMNLRRVGHQYEDLVHPEDEHLLVLLLYLFLP
jgi:hypothetical protein